MARRLTRRQLLRSLGGACLSNAALAQKVQPLLSTLPETSALKLAAQHAGKTLGTFVVGYQLKYQPTDAAIIAKTFSLIATGNDLKFSKHLRPAPDVFDFGYSDLVVSWAEAHQMLFRGHCLVWWNALPDWFQSYVTPANAAKVMTDHIQKVVGHYARRVYSWDVVNEAIYHDSPDGIRRKPWRNLVGDDYIELAFHTAAAADPKAKLLINECYIEHATPDEKFRRDQYLRLITRLKQSRVPIHGVGVQGHLRGVASLDRPGLTSFAQQVRDMGLELLITELDVDNVGVPPADVDKVTASKYSEFIDILGPYVKVITLEALEDYPAGSGAPDAIARANIFDVDYQPKQAFASLTDALNRLPSRSHV